MSTRTAAACTQGFLGLPDGTALAYTLSVPRPGQAAGAAADAIKLALIAHPLGRLGGTQDDHVVQTLAAVLRRAGWAVCTYDARGAGASTGSASFTAAPEAADYEAVLRRVVLPLLADSDVVAVAVAPPQLLLAGYSAGALAASSCKRPRPSAHPRLATRHLLISYPLSVLWALTLGHSSTLHRALRDLVDDPASDVLAIFGDADQFSSVGSLRTWRDGLVAAGAGRFKGVEVAGADHFWRGEQMDELVREVSEWLGIE